MLPPVASTRPSASSVPVTRRRCDDSGAVGVIVGCTPPGSAVRKSISTAAFDSPPNWITRPGWYITAVVSGAK